MKGFVTGKVIQYSVVTVPFPFTDKTKSKRRPALVISTGKEFNNIIGHSVLAMITSSKNSPWPLDTPIKNLKKAGLPAPSIIRLKLFTIDHRLIMSVLGQLSEEDILVVKKSLRHLMT